MPATFAHPAAVLLIGRFFKRWRLLPALIVGSVAPDIPYYLPLGLGRNDTHNLAGIIWFCIPAGLLVLWAYQAFWRPVIMDLLPEKLAGERAARESGARFHPGRKRYLALAIAIGALTHVFWDNMIWLIGGKLDISHNIFQAINTILGTLVIGCVVWKRYRSRLAELTIYDFRYVLFLVLSSGFLAVISAAMMTGWEFPPPKKGDFAIITIVSGTIYLMIIITAAGIRERFKRTWPGIFFESGE